VSGHSFIHPFIYSLPFHSIPFQLAPTSPNRSAPAAEQAGLFELVKKLSFLVVASEHEWRSKQNKRRGPAAAVLSVG
jgi:hypothetical protein